jgi:hypothetical protein
MFHTITNCLESIIPFPADRKAHNVDKKLYPWQSSCIFVALHPALQPPPTSVGGSPMSKKEWIWSEMYHTMWLASCICVFFTYVLSILVLTPSLRLLAIARMMHASYNLVLLDWSQLPTSFTINQAELHWVVRYQCWTLQKHHHFHKVNHLRLKVVQGLLITHQMDCKSSTDTSNLADHRHSVTRSHLSPKKSF